MWYGWQMFGSVLQMWQPSEAACTSVSRSGAPLVFMPNSGRSECSELELFLFSSQCSSFAILYCHVTLQWLETDTNGPNRITGTNGPAKNRKGPGLCSSKSILHLLNDYCKSVSCDLHLRSHRDAQTHTYTHALCVSKSAMSSIWITSVDKFISGCGEGVYITSLGRPTDINWLTVGQGLLSLYTAGTGRGGVFISSVSSLSFLFSFFPVPIFHLLYYLLLFSGRRHRKTHKGWRVVR